MVEREFASFIWMDAIVRNDATKRAPGQKGAPDAKNTMETKRF
jgi:hypothetical protein